MDPTFATNWQGMHAAGLVRTAYHFGRPGKNATVQAQFFVRQVLKNGGFHQSSTLPLVLDLEVTDGKSPVRKTLGFVLGAVARAVFRCGC